MVGFNRKALLACEPHDEVVGTRLPSCGVDVFFSELPFLQPVRYVVVDAEFPKPAAT